MGIFEINNALLPTIPGQYNVAYIDRLILSAEAVLIDKGEKFAMKVLNNEDCKESVCELNMLRWAIKELSKYVPIGQKASVENVGLFLFTFDYLNINSNPVFNVSVWTDGIEYKLLENEEYELDASITILAFFNKVVKDINDKLVELKLDHIYGAQVMRSDWMYWPTYADTDKQYFIVFYTNAFQQKDMGCIVNISNVTGYTEEPAAEIVEGFYRGFRFVIQKEECCITKEMANYWINYLQSKYPICCIDASCDEPIFENYLPIAGFKKELDALGYTP